MATLSSQSPNLLKNEEEIAKEFEDVLSSLPRELGWGSFYLYKYKGFWLGPRTIVSMPIWQEYCQSHKIDVMLASIPKSGTTWLKAIVFALANRVDCPVNDDHPLLTTNPHDLVPFVEFVAVESNPKPTRLSPTSPLILSTHLPEKLILKYVRDSGCKIIFISRNVKDNFVSYFHYTNKLGSKSSGNHAIEEVFNKFCRGVTLDGPFWDHVLGYWKARLEKPDKVFFLKYEEMKEQPVLHLRRLANFLGRPFTLEEDSSSLADKIVKLCSFDILRNLEVNKHGKTLFGETNQLHFRKGEVGDWKNYLTPQMAHRLDQITEEKFHKYGLKL